MLCDDARAGGSAAQADGDQNDVRGRQLVENFNGHCAHAGDQLRFVRRVHVAKFGLRQFGFDVHTRFVKVSTVLDQPCSESSYCRILSRIVSDRDDDRAFNSEFPSRVRQRLTVVAGRASENAGSAFFIIERRNQVDAASNFEGSDRQMVLVLNVVFAAEQFAQTGPLIERSRFQN